MDDDEPQKKPKAGAPAWLGTFADMMSLLMCFFVLLLSFSETDRQKYKEVAGSMANAFGVQKDIQAPANPMGTSFVSKDFSPGRPDKTQIRPIQVNKEFGMNVEGAPPTPEERIQEELKPQVEEGLIDVTTEGLKTVIRIRERGSFASGSADLLDGFLPAVARIAAILGETPGRIVVSGHTDDVPIHTARYRSNWELSTSRAVTVMEELVKGTGLSDHRFLIEGHGDTQPMVPNDGPVNRALNRRVVITLEQDPPQVDTGGTGPSGEDE